MPSPPSIANSCCECCVALAIIPWPMVPPRLRSLLLLLPFQRCTRFIGYTVVLPLYRSFVSSLIMHPINISYAGYVQVVRSGLHRYPCLRMVPSRVYISYAILRRVYRYLLRSSLSYENAGVCARFAEMSWVQIALVYRTVAVHGIEHPPRMIRLLPQFAGVLSPRRACLPPSDMY